MSLRLKKWTEKRNIAGRGFSSQIPQRVCRCSPLDRGEVGWVVLVSEGPPLGILCGKQETLGRDWDTRSSSSEATGLRVDGGQVWLGLSIRKSPIGRLFY